MLQSAWFKIKQYIPITAMGETRNVFETNHM